MKSLIAILAIIMITGCSSRYTPRYTPELAKENGDVVADYGIVGNVEKLDAFISNIDKNQGAEVKITRLPKKTLFSFI